MNVSLTTELEAFVARKVSSGRYQTASEVVREGLRLLEERDSEKHGFMVSSEEELRQKIEEGIRSLEEGGGIELKNKGELRELFEGIKTKGRKRQAMTTP